MKRSIRTKETRPNGKEILLGRLQPANAAIGFSESNRTPEKPSGLITYQGDKHLCTVAPTRAGKGTDVIIPNLLQYKGTTICIDPKGENFMVTAKQRRKLGHRIVKLDPFGQVDDLTDSLNPMDAFHLKKGDLECDSQTVAALLSRGLHGLKEPFWDISGTAFVSGLIAHAASNDEPERRNLISVMDHFGTDDISYNLATLLDANAGKMNPLAYHEIASFLQMPDVTRGGVLATAQSYFKPLLTPKVSRTLKQSSFDLQEVVDGAPITIYLILPPNRFHSHRGLLKLWVATLLLAIFSRESQPELKTYFVLDEVAQLGNFPLLEELLTLSAGYGTWVHTFWQDLSQIRNCYPESWRTILNNCGVLQAFGFNNRSMATEWSEYFNTGVERLQALAPDDQILTIQSEGELIAKRVTYLNETWLKKIADQNRFYAKAKKSVGR